MSLKRRHDSYGNLEPSSKSSRTAIDDFHEALTLLDDNPILVLYLFIKSIQSSFFMLKFHYL